MKNTPNTKLSQAKEDLRAYLRGHGDADEKRRLEALIRHLERKEAAR